VLCCEWEFASGLCTQPDFSQGHEQGARGLFNEAAFIRFSVARYLTANDANHCIPAVYVLVLPRRRFCSGREDDLPRRQDKGTSMPSFKSSQPQQPTTSTCIVVLCTER
jgi:hypothetical protein